MGSPQASGDHRLWTGCPRSAGIWPSQPACQGLVSLPDSRPPSPALLQRARQSSSCQPPAPALHQSLLMVLKALLHLRQKPDHSTSSAWPGTAEQDRTRVNHSPVSPPTCEPYSCLGTSGGFPCAFHQLCLRDPDGPGATNPAVTGCSPPPAVGCLAVQWKH